MLAGWKETHTGGAVVSFFLPNPADLDVFRGLTVHKGGKGGKVGVAGHRFMAVLVEIGDDETPKSSVNQYVENGEASQDYRNNLAGAALDKVATVEVKPFGKQASLLHSCGFYFNPHVMEKVGTDQEYLNWTKTQPCCVRGSLIADKAHDGDIVPAHVRRIANGAGTGIKPEYSAVPMCNKHHQLQHQSGESAVGGKQFLDRERAHHISRWMAKRLFNKESMGHVNPVDVITWAASRNISQYLPESYR